MDLTTMTDDDLAALAVRFVDGGGDPAEMLAAVGGV